MSAAHTLPHSMKAAVVAEANGPFRIVDKPVPAVEAGQVLVRVIASGVNPLDTKIRTGAAGHAKHPFPAILGMDLAGVVEKVGDGVHTFKVGDQVYGFVGGIGGHQGTLAQYVAADARLLGHKPKNLSFREASVLPLVVITAWEGLVDRARTGKDSTVLIHGGAGGVGSVAIQIAKARGAKVFATGTRSQFETIRSLGATPIDYTTTDAPEYVEQHTGGDGFDVVYDTVGGATLDASFIAAKRYTGHVVSALGWGTHALAPLSFRGATYSGVFTLMPLLLDFGRENHGRILQSVREMVEAGQVRPLIDPTEFTLTDVGSAHALVTTGDAKGKVAVTID